MKTTQEKWENLFPYSRVNGEIINLSTNNEIAKTLMIISDLFISKINKGEAVTAKQILTTLLDEAATFLAKGQS